MSKKVYYVGKRIIESVKDNEGRVVHLGNEEAGIIGVVPVFEKLSKARMAANVEPMQMVIRSADRR